MPALSIQSPYLTFTDSDGQPLENGYVWIGQANLDPQVNSINVFWDAALTIPAGQPIRTLGGYPVYNGAPARLYVNSDYSIRVMNKNGSVLYSAPESTNRYDSLLRIDLASTASGKGAALVGYDSGTVQSALDTLTGPTGAETVGYTPSGTGAVATTVQSKLRERVSIKDFGAVGDGVTDDTAAIQAAVAASNSIVVPPGNYYLGEYSSSNDVVFQLHNGTYNIQNIGDVTFTLRTATGTGDCFPVVFDLKGAGGSSFGKFRFRDLGYDDSTSNRRGLKAYRLTADGSTGSWGDVSIDRIQCNNCISPISFEGADSNNRVRGVHVSEIALENCYYGPLCQNQGDNFTVDVLSGSQVRRIYFVYGCKTHDVRIIDRNPKGSTGTINISRSAGGFNTEGLNIRYSCREASVANQLYANINHIDLLGGAIRGVRLHLDIDVPVAAVPLRFINYDGPGGNESTAASTNIVDDVVVTGTFGSTSSVIDTIASYGSRGYLDVTARNATIGAVTREAFMLENDEGTWTPVLVDSDLNTGEGQTASVAIGTFQKRGRVVTFTGRLRMTSLGSLNTSSAAIISGLPYKSGNVSNRIGSFTVFSASNLNLTAAAAIVGYVSQNNSIITLQKWSATTGTTGLAISEISADGEIAFSGSYTV
jgi:hypothetical protein